ncbi:MAG: hypothetical protein M1816_001513 [Peltula sp. TS41687]|nr:MAG: hypothetical protein M1816_001513 [Peltula sp. TS41687]
MAEGQPSAVPEPAYADSLFNPINLILFSLLGLIIWYQLRPRAAITKPAHAGPIVFRTFTPRTLLPYNGRGSASSSANNKDTSTDGGDQASIYMGIRGTVFDVTPGKQFYGPMGPYANFAGRDASRGLALGSFDEDMLTKDLDGPLDDLRDLGPDEVDALNGWEERFREKYLVVGRLVAEGALEGGAG